MPPPKVPPKRDASELDSTVLAPRPDLTDETGDIEDHAGDGIVFSEDSSDSRTVVGREKPKLPEVSSSDVSLIEAKESFEAPRITSFGDGALVEDYHPPTEVLKLAFSTPDEEAVEPASALDEPVEVRKWKMGLPGASPAGPAPAARPAHEPEPTRAPDRSRASLFSLPPAEQGGGTRVDALHAGRPVVSLDVDELRKNLEEAERLLKTVKQQLAALDLESRGTNAQLAAALHRLGEALAMLRR